MTHLTADTKMLLHIHFDSMITVRPNCATQQFSAKLLQQFLSVKHNTQHAVFTA